MRFLFTLIGLLELLTTTQPSFITSDQANVVSEGNTTKQQSAQRHLQVKKGSNPFRVGTRTAASGLVEPPALYTIPWWLKVEAQVVKNEIAFGLFAPGARAIHLELVSLWWVDGAVGCVFPERPEPLMSSEKLKSLGLPGLEQCVFPQVVAESAWFSSTKSSGFAALPLLLFEVPSCVLDFPNIET